MRYLLWTALFVVLLPPAAQANEPLQRYQFRQRHMGTEFRITLYAADEPAANTAAQAAFSRIEQLDAIFSDYDEQSELRRLCRNSGPGKPVPVSRELLEVLTHAVRLSRQTDGGFDVTVGHLTRLWRRARRRKQLPKPQELKAALAKTGYRFIRIDRTRNTVELLKAGMRLDLGGIAKGYAGDEALKTIRKHGLSRAMIDAGGDIVAGDPPPGKPGWTIGIAPLKHKPATGKRPESNVRYLVLNNAAVATSGDAFQYVVIDGKRYSHIIDPKTGLGITRRSQVTVIAPNGMRADSLASAVSVLGPACGRQLIARHDNVEASVSVVRQRDKVQQRDKVETLQTCGFRRFLRQKRTGMPTE